VTSTGRPGAAGRNTSTYPIWGWGLDSDDAPTAADLTALTPLVADHLGLPVQHVDNPAPLADLPPVRVRSRLPAALVSIASAEAIDRARHGVGRSYRDVVRGIRGQIDHVPDVVLRPQTEADIVDTFDWCSSTHVAVVPFGGGTSVVGGVEPDVGDDWAGIISLDLSALSGVVEVDAVSRAALVRGGTTGPALEAALRGHALTARFYPQSFERSTVGGWVATRAAGHFSTGAVHIDDMVESIRAMTPIGEWASRRLPGSGAGPSPDRLLLGSEGSLGVVTEAWLRVQPRPTHRWSASFGAPDLATGVGAVRSIVQAGLRPATCRLIDAGEAAVTGTSASGEAVLVVGTESWSAPLDTDTAQIITACADGGLRLIDDGVPGGAGEVWRSSFLRAPYLREQLVLLGLIVETFETAATWDRLLPLIDSVKAATGAALNEICGAGTVTCRITHVYPDGAAAYFTVLAPGRHGSELAQWSEVKAAASEAILAYGGTITHHHSVGRDHRPWYAAQRPAPFAAAFAAAKRAVDPAGILNPGVLVETASS
jgi:alkyldihydroxyacetonephosphate synthase